MIQCTDDDKRRLPLPLESKSGIDAAFGKSKGGLGAGASTLSTGGRSTWSVWSRLICILAILRLQVRIYIHLCLLSWSLPFLLTTVDECSVVASVGRSTLIRDNEVFATKDAQPALKLMLSLSCSLSLSLYPSQTE